jgi:riboflavin kinase, archaea type
VGLEVSGTAFSGMGKGRYYVGHPEYQRRFEAALGYRPYPGTLNVKLSDREVIRRLGKLRTTGGTKIPGFTLKGEEFSSLTCVDGTMSGEKVTLLFIDITQYNETVAELISPVYLRGKLGIRDGDEVTFRLDKP